MTVYLKNNSVIAYMIEDLGVLIEPGETIDIYESLEHKEACDSPNLKEAVTNGIVSIFIDTKQLLAQEEKNNSYLFSSLLRTMKPLMSIDHA